MKTASPVGHEGDALLPGEKHRRRRSVEGELPVRKRVCNPKFSQPHGVFDKKCFVKNCPVPGTPKDSAAVSIWAHIEIEDVVRCWQRLAQQGCQHAQYSLGLCFDRGHGVRHDMRSAAQLWKSAAESGHA